MMIYATCHAAEIAVIDVMMTSIKTKDFLNLIKIAGDCIMLITRDIEDIGETTTAGETAGCYLIERLI